MTPRKVDTLPADIRRELDARAQAAGWGDVRGLSVWLSEQGYSISKSAVGEHVSALKAEYDSTMREMREMAALARVMIDDDPDEQASLHDLASRLVTDQLVRAAKDLRQAQGMPIEERIPLLARIAQPITQAQRAAVYSRRWSAEQQRAAEQAAREAALAAGVDAGTAERIASGITIYLPDNQRRGAGG